MDKPGVMSGAAFDVHNLDAIRLAAKRSPQQGLKAAAQQLEGLFVQMMLKSMRDASFKGGLFDNQQSEMFTSLYDQQISQDIAAQGKLGFADLIARQLHGSDPASASGQGHEALISSFLAATQHPRTVAHAALRQDNPERETGVDDESPDNGAFVARLVSPARDIARKSGIPHQLIIAQAALESGWGNRQILTREGKPSFNLFGIKATPDWKGATTEIATTEYINGVAEKVKATFRVYKNYADALSDYAAFLTRNPRYQNVINSPSLEHAAHALQNGGYATDPNYAKKLMNIIRYVEKNLSGAAENYKKDFDTLF
ncbi:flagellar protein FlgJ [Enterobacter sp. BIGb0383]|uniref:flagellar assembly peptidoglycan hydrolase FlgJ n=1 Tax=unclassified Enterobacter TaxID=2608935 RepID=UPI000F4AD337|nr:MULTISPECIES: flagellar assembly peptidoglycan hydrolase FlgJ [unclassified Enterobacter]ROP58306.1 flagellar protein FlgJ [Enterobacter sp. BIGb0383]ROS06806.1 flagellar protein FlgJ [Enterobacter sp. BIGb0359]